MAHPTEVNLAMIYGDRPDFILTKERESGKRCGEVGGSGWCTIGILPNTLWCEDLTTLNLDNFLSLPSLSVPYYALVAPFASSFRLVPSTRDDAK